MVYCGKPSKSCDACRAKRTKCDRAIPSCTQCIRVGRDCPGYRDEQALMFRDETIKVVDRVGPRKKDRNASPPDMVALTRSRRLSPENPGPIILASRQSMIRSPARTIEDEAINFFFYHYCLQDHRFAKGLFDYLPNMYQCALATNEPLGEIVKASGMAGIANLKRSSDIEAAARAKQTAVLRSINLSLQNPKEAISDSTIMAVLLLGLFETITCSSPRSMKAWANHTRGAITLAHMRGEAQFESETGRRIFLHLRNQALIDCLQRRIPIPKVIQEWHGPASQAGDVHSTLFQLLIRVCDLRHLHKVRGVVDSNMLEEAKRLDADLEEWPATCVEPAYRYQVVPDPQSCPRYKYRHIYSSAWLATAWNVFRVGRIYAGEIIFERYQQESQIDLDSARLLERRKFVREQLSNDICASAPFYIDGNEGLGFARSPLAMRAAGGFSLLWPLWTAGHAYPRSSQQTSWIIEQYEKIYNLYGIRQAQSLANILRTDREITIFDKDPTQPLDNEELLNDW